MRFYVKLSKYDLNLTIPQGHILHLNMLFQCCWWKCKVLQLDILYIQLHQQCLLDTTLIHNLFLVLYYLGSISQLHMLSMLYREN